MRMIPILAKIVEINEMRRVIPPSFATSVPVSLISRLSTSFGEVVAIDIMLPKPPPDSLSFWGFKSFCLLSSLEEFVS